MKKHMRSIYLVVLWGVLGLILALALPGIPAALLADDPDVAPIAVLLDSEPVQLDMQPIVVGWRTMAPFRGIFEALGYTVSWDGDSQTVTADKGGARIVMQIDNRSIRYGDIWIESDAAPMIQNGRTLVPVRIIGELSGYDVLWNGDTRTVLIYSKLPEGVTPQRFTYPYMICDGSNIYKGLWAEDGARATIRISLRDFSLTELLPYGANDYSLYGGKLYGRFGFESRLSYGAYDLTTGKTQNVTDFDVAGCYLYRDHLYYTDSFGPYATTLYRMSLDGGDTEELFQGNERFPLGDYAIKDDILFSGYMDSLFVLPLYTMEPVDLISLCGLKAYRLMLGGMAVSGDCFYASLSRYRGMSLAPFAILQYNYKSGEWHILETDYVIEDLFVTDNSIFFSAENTDGLYDYYTYDLYRADSHGKNPVLLKKGVFREWLICGDFLYFTLPDDSGNTAVARIAADGSRFQVVAVEPAPGIREVEVSTAAELADAIGSDTCVTLKEGRYDLSALEASTLYVTGVSNLTLQAAPGAQVEIVTNDPWAEALWFEDCDGLTLRGIKAGHSLIVDYECDAGVALFNYSSNILIEDCYFYGCGSVGIEMTGCRDADILETTIADCSLYAVTLEDCSGINFSFCGFVDHRAYMSVVCANRTAASFTDCAFSGNHQVEHGVVWVDYAGLGSQRGAKSDIYLTRCTFTDNGPGEGYQAGSAIVNGSCAVRDCVVEKGGFALYWTKDIRNLGGNALK